jgi:hypothetical protein
MSNSTNLGWLRQAIVDKSGKPTKALVDYISKMVEPVLSALAVRTPAVGQTPATAGAVGNIQSSAVVQGRTEGIGTTVSNLSSAGTLQAAGVGFTADNVPAGVTHAITTNNQVTGAARAFSALNSNSQLAGSGNNNPLNTSSAPGSTTILSNNGSATAITVAALTQQFGFGTVSYAASSFDPGAFGTWYAWYVDPTFSGGTLTPQFSTSPVNLTSSDGIVPLGAITTASGSSKTGGGFSGGTTSGGAGGRGFINV